MRTPSAEGRSSGLVRFLYRRCLRPGTRFRIAQLKKVIIRDRNATRLCSAAEACTAGKGVAAGKQSRAGQGVRLRMDPAIDSNTPLACLESFASQALFDHAVELRPGDIDANPHTNGVQSAATEPSIERRTGHGSTRPSTQDAPCIGGRKHRNASRCSITSSGRRKRERRSTSQTCGHFPPSLPDGRRLLCDSIQKILSNSRQPSPVSCARNIRLRIRYAELRPVQKQR
jgi:hypothetical protein